MPTDSLIAVVGVLSAFAFFAGTLIYADMTADRPARQTGRRH